MELDQTVVVSQLTVHVSDEERRKCKLCPGKIDAAAAILRRYGVLHLADALDTGQVARGFDAVM